jgi:hypothetical protein
MFRLESSSDWEQNWELSHHFTIIGMGLLLNVLVPKYFRIMKKNYIKLFNIMAWRFSVAFM